MTKSQNVLNEISIAYMTGKQLVKALQEAGWVIDRRARHTILKKESQTVPVPIHGNKKLAHYRGETDMSGLETT